MKKLFLFLALTTGAEAAAPVIAAVFADYVDYSVARITVRTTTVLTAPRLRIHYGYAHDNTPFIMGDPLSPNPTYVCVPVDLDYVYDTFIPDRTECSSQALRLQAGTKVYLSLEFDDGGVPNTIWGCNAGAITEGTLSGLTCGAGETKPYFTTLPMPGPWYMNFPAGTGPQQPTVPTYNYPTIVPVEGTNSFTVNDACDNLQAKLDLAQAAVASRNVEIRFPYGPAHPCPAFAPITNSGPYFAVYRSNAPDANLPPPVGRVAEHHYPWMSYINTQVSGAALSLNSTQSYSIFMGLYLTVKDKYPTTPVVPLKIIKSEKGFYQSVWILTVEGQNPPGLQRHSVVALTGVASYNASCGPGLMLVDQVYSANTFQIYCGDPVIPVDPIDTTLLGWGVVPESTQRLVNVIPGGCAGGLTKLVLDGVARWGLSDNNVIHIVDVKGVTGINNKGWRVSGANNNEICLQASTAVTGTHVAGSGIYAIEAPTPIIVDTFGVNQMWFDRVVMEGHGFPNRLFANVSMTACSNCGVLNSQLMHTGGWLAIDPVTGSYATYSHDPSGTTGYALEVTYTSNLRIENNYISGNGILIFGQDNKVTEPQIGYPVANNHTIRGNTFVSPPEYIAGNPDSDGLHHAHRHHIEYKSGNVIRIEGNEFIGNYADEVPNAPTISISVRQMNGEYLKTYVDGILHSGETRDYSIVNNYFQHCGGVLKIAYDSDTRRYGTAPVRCFEFSNNIVHNLDWFHMRSLPNTNSQATPLGSYSSGEMVGLNPSHGFVLRNNTEIHQNGMSPIWIGLAGYSIPLTHAIILDNLFQDNRTSNSPPGGIGMGAIPWSGTVKASWDTISQIYTPAGPAGDPNSFWAGNIIVPGSENNQEYGFWDTSCYGSTGQFCNWTQAEVDAYWGTGNSTSGTYYSTPHTGFTADTPTGRETEVGYYSISSGNYRVKTAAPVYPATGLSFAGIGVGANQDVIAAAAKKHRNLRVNTVRTTSATVAFTAPVAAMDCYVSCPTCPTARQVNNTNQLNRTTALSGLTAGATYAVAVSCGNVDEALTFQTTP